MPYSADWFSQNIPHWEWCLAKFKGKPNLTFLEIGCFEGKATVWLLKNILTDPTSHIIVIDTFDGGQEAGSKKVFYNPKVEQYFKENIAPYHNKVTTMKGLSQGIVRGFDADILDFVYIDGSHRAVEVLEDSVYSWLCLKKGGIIIWDDYGLKRYSDPKENPKMAIDHFLEVYAGKYKMISKKYQVCIEKL